MYIYQQEVDTCVDICILFSPFLFLGISGSGAELASVTTIAKCTDSMRNKAL